MDEADVLETMRVSGFGAYQEVFVTLAEKLTEKGRKEGEKLGVARGRKEGESLGKLHKEQQVLIRQLTQKFGLSPDEESLILREQDPERLDHALDTVFVAQTKAEVLSHLHESMP